MLLMAIVKPKGLDLTCFGDKASPKQENDVFFSSEISITPYAVPNCF